MKAVPLDPEPGILIESLRDIGYSFNSALADIIDNSITAGAETVKVFAIPADDFQVAVIDDGHGMSAEELLQAMRLGSKDPRQERERNDLGRFGLGLKTASFSQCRKLTVVTRTENNSTAYTWDLDAVVENNEWFVYEHPDLDAIPFVEHLKSHGTLVLWEMVDRLTGERGSGQVEYGRVISEAQEYLSLVFHRYISGERDLAKIDMFVNELALDPIDPFNVSHDATQVSPEEVVAPGVVMQTYTLPHKSMYKSDFEYERYGLRNGYLRNQGVYLYRAKRLIIHGTWFGLAKKTAITQLTRVRIDIDVNQDEKWKIDVKKVSAQMPEVVRERLRNLINAIGAPSRRTYKRRAAVLTSEERHPVWNALKEGSSKLYRLNRTHPFINAFQDELEPSVGAKFRELLSLIEASFPTEALFFDLSNNEGDVKFPSLPEEDVKGIARTIFAELQARGLEEDLVIATMKTMSTFGGRWTEVERALEVKEK